MSNTELEKSINKLYAEPNTYFGFPAPVLYKSQYGYTRCHCPVKDCSYDGLPRGFNQHYARIHEPNQWRQHAKRVIKVIV